MERELPKNVRQIGNVSDNPKIYVEDYVDTFFNQLCDKADNMPLGAFLIGDTDKEKEQEYIFIHGAIQIHDVEMKGTEVAIGDDAWKTAYEECKQFFDTGEIIGWFVTVPGFPLGINDKIVKAHEKAFAKKSSVFIMKDTTEREEIYYAYKYNDLMDLGGHYIYYEKNPSMQNYMISSRRQNGVTPSESVEDRAAKNFRSLIRTREEQNSHKSSTKFIYAASVVLVLLVVVVGITTINNYDKMQSVQTSLEHISNSVVSKENKQNEQEGAKADQGQMEQASAEAEQTAGEQVLTGGELSDAPEQAAGSSPDVVGEAAVSAGGTGQSMEEGVYVVEKGDTLAIISKKSYGDTSHIDAICRMNGLTDGNLIFIGQKLMLP